MKILVPNFRKKGNLVEGGGTWKKNEWEQSMLTCAEDAREKPMALDACFTCNCKSQSAVRRELPEKLDTNSEDEY